MGSSMQKMPVGKLMKKPAGSQHIKSHMVLYPFGRNNHKKYLSATVQSLE